MCFMSFKVTFVKSMLFKIDTMYILFRILICAIVQCIFMSRSYILLENKYYVSITGIELSDDPEMTYLVNPVKVPIIQTFLRTIYNVPVNAEDLSTLTAAK